MFNHDGTIKDREKLVMGKLIENLHRVGVSIMMYPNMGLCELRNKYGPISGKFPSNKLNAVVAGFWVGVNAAECNHGIAHDYRIAPSAHE